MDVRTQPRERVFSILNDNDCPSFVIRQRRSPSPDRSSYSKSPRQERPSLLRQTQYKRTSSFSSTDSSPPLLRYDSTSSKASSSSMDSSPSPITPAYNFNDPNVLPYDNVLRQDLVGFMPSPTTITPLMEQSFMIAPNGPDVFPMKSLSQQPMAQYPILPAPSHTDVAQLPTPAPSNNSVSNSTSVSSTANKTSPSTSGPTPGKKNKYPCPYAQSHNCSATFTTSGHAARHGKKHTGEKGVHCPICNKAFTRKDNMKQHERTHRGSVSGSNSEGPNPRRSKAAVTRDAQKTKQIKKQDSTETSISDPTTHGSSLIRSPLSQSTSLDLSVAENQLAINEQQFFPESNPVMMPQTIQPNVSPSALYPPLNDDALLPITGLAQPVDNQLPGLPMANLPMPPLVRGFSDLDTLAQAAESFDPAYQTNI